MTLTALPTTYAGHTFRSRLEADWAATLDNHTIAWEYEPEGYLLTDGTRYLPDFYLPAIRAWIEVKGDHMDRYSKVEQFAADLWAASGARDTHDPAAPMVILAKTPIRGETHPGDLAWLAPNMVGVTGPGKTHSVGFTTCPECHAQTIFAFGQSHCRTCHAASPLMQDELLGGWLDEQHGRRPFVRLPRPFQNGGRS